MDGIRKSSGSACWQPGGRWRSPELTGDAREECMVELGVEPGKGAGRPRKIHPVGQMVQKHLALRREELMARCRDRFRNFRVEVAVLFLAGYSPGMARGFFEDVFHREHNRHVAVSGGRKKGFSISGFERGYRVVAAELMSGDLVGLIGPEWLALLKKYGLGPWAQDAPEWMRNKFGVTPEAVSSVMEPPAGLPAAPVVPPSVAEIPHAGFVPLVCPVAEKSAAEKVRELDEYIAGVEAKYGTLGLQLRDYTRALEVGFFAFMAEREARTRMASGGSDGSDDGCLKARKCNLEEPKGESGLPTGLGDDAKGGATVGNTFLPSDLPSEPPRERAIEPEYFNPYEIQKYEPGVPAEPELAYAEYYSDEDSPKEEDFEPPSATPRLEMLESAGNGESEKQWILREFRHSLVLSRPSELIHEGHATFFPHLHGSTQDELYADWRSWCSRKDEFPKSFRLFELDQELFEVMARRGYSFEMAYPELTHRKILNVGGLLLMMEGVIERAFGLVVGKESQSGRIYVQYGPRWSLEVSTEMVVRNVRKWYDPMNPWRLESRKPLSEDLIPSGYVWVPFRGLYSLDDCERARKIVRQGAWRADYSSRDTAIQADEMEFSKALVHSLGFVASGKSGPVAEFNYRGPVDQVGFGHLPFGVRFPYKFGRVNTPWLELQNMSPGFFPSHGGSIELVLLQQLDKIPTRIHYPSLIKVYAGTEPLVQEHWNRCGLSEETAKPFSVW